MEQINIAKVSLMLQEAIVKKEVDASLAMVLIAKGMEIMETYKDLQGNQKKELLVKVMEKVASGSDGIVGTEDDLIPKETVDTLKSLLTQNLLGQVMSIVKDAARGKFNLQATISVATEVQKKCLPGLLACFKKVKGTKKGEAYKVA